MKRQEPRAVKAAMIKLHTTRRSGVIERIPPWNLDILFLCDVEPKARIASVDRRNDAERKPGKEE